MSAGLHVPGEAIRAVIVALGDDPDDPDDFNWSEGSDDLTEARTVLAAAAPHLLIAEMRSFADALEQVRDDARANGDLQRAAGIGGAVIALRARIGELTEGGAR